MCEALHERMIPLVAHADWSINPNKRWMCVATPAENGWRVGLEQAAPVGDILPSLRRRAGPAPVAFGVDAPIGLPDAYRTGHPDFRAFLAHLTPTSDFFSVADTPDQIALGRPFYPNRARLGMTRQELTAGIGVTDAAHLLRRCERATLGRPAASPLFWTVGAKQAGKGAISLWRDLLLPALRSPAPPSLWPFDGLLATLLRPGRTVIAETYPAHAMRQIDLRFTGSKTRQADRARVADRLRAILQGLATDPDDGLAAAIADGFGAASNGEDRFDSLLGLLGMLQVVRDPALDCPPETDAVRRWEGWILGRPLSIS